MYCKYLHHPGIAKIQYKTFFHMCRLRNISFDLEQRTGSTFMLQDCLQSGLLAMMTIDQDRVECLRRMCDAFKFVEELAGSAALIRNESLGAGPDEARTDEIECNDVISAVRLIFKTYQKRAERDRAARQNRISKAL